MMNLDEIQRGVFDAVRQPLTASEGMRQRTRDGRSTREIAEAIIKPNNRLTSFERLEIYNRQYWLRILSMRRAQRESRSTWCDWSGLRSKRLTRRRSGH